MSGAANDPLTLRQKIEGLRQSLVQQILNPQADLPNVEPISAFRVEYARLQDQLKQLQHRQQSISKAKAEYQPLDNARQQTAKELAAAEANLKQLGRPLGKAAFEGLTAGQVQSQPLFNERSAVRTKIAELHAEHDRLAPPQDAGMVQKTKAKAQQLVVAGKIKLEEMKVGKLEEQIGRELIAANREDSVRCELTAGPLAALAKHRSMIAQRKQECEKARVALDTKKQKLGQALTMASIEGSNSFDAEQRNCETQIAQIDNQRSNLEKQLPERLLACGALDAQSSLGQLLRDYREVQAQWEATPNAKNASGFIETAATATQKAAVFTQNVRDGIAKGVRGIDPTFWENPAVVILSCIFCFPVGVVLIWIHSSWTQRQKWLGTAVAGGFLIFVFLMSAPDNKNTSPDDQIAREWGVDEGPLKNLNVTTSQAMKLFSDLDLTWKNTNHKQLGEQVQDVWEGDCHQEGGRLSVTLYSNDDMVVGCLFALHDSGDTDLHEMDDTELSDHIDLLVTYAQIARSAGVGLTDWPDCGDWVASAIAKAKTPGYDSEQRIVHNGVRITVVALVDGVCTNFSSDAVLRAGGVD